MCNFFSFVGDGYGNYLYSDWAARKEIIDLKSGDYPDSHTRILTCNKVPAKMQDRWSKYEFNPLTKEFTVDQGVEGHDHESAEAWVNRLDFKQIVPQLVIKDIKNSLVGRVKKVTEREVQLLKEWSSVWYSVRASVWYSVRASVRASVWYSFGDSVRDSVGDSVRASVGDSVRASVWAYISSFFDILYAYNFSSCVKLWETGFLPSFDGTTWRLHSGSKAKAVFEISAEELKASGK